MVILIYYDVIDHRIDPPMIATVRFFQCKFNDRVTRIISVTIEQQVTLIL